MTQKQKAKSKDKVEVLDLRRPKVKPPKLRRWIALALILLSIGTIVGLMKTASQVPTIPTSNNNNGKGPSRITIVPNATNPSGTGTGTPPPPSQVAVWVHGKASSKNFVVQTVAFEGLVTLDASVNFDPNSQDFQTYALYVPNGTYTIQLWQNSIPSDTRPSCNVVVTGSNLNLIVTVSGADQVANFTC